MNILKKHTIISALILYFIIGIGWANLFASNSGLGNDIMGYFFVAAVWPLVAFLALVQGPFIIGIVGIILSLSLFIIFALIIRRINQKEAAVIKK
ncbi:MAG: hypothetical protein WC528_05440 [Patescibacteria group bacterium]